MLNDTINILSLESYREQIETIELVKEKNHLVYLIKQKKAEHSVSNMWVYGIAYS